MSSNLLPRAIRISKYLSIRFSEGNYSASNEFVGEPVRLPASIIALISKIPNYESHEIFIATLEKIYSQPGIGETVGKRLLETGIFIEDDSVLAKLEDQFVNWSWGKSTAAHFLATRRVQWYDEDREVELFGAKLKRGDAPRLWADIDDGSNWQPLGISPLASDVHATFGKRRSVRQFSGAAVASEKLGAILNAGLGVSGFLELPMRPTFPLRYTPSPGGLNCFAAYLIVQNVEGIDCGIYKYNALLNQIKYIGKRPSERLGELFGNQKWAEEAAVMIALVADYKKMSWKYGDASAFNSLLIESGHIAQNMMICASQLDIGSVPTNAVDQPRLEKYFELQFPEQAVIYSVGIGIQDRTRDIDYYSKESLAKLKAIVHD